MVLRSVAVWAALLAAVPTGATEVAEAEVEWDVAGQWRILVNAAVGNGCLMERTYDDGTLVRIGVVPNRHGGFIAAYNADWVEIQEGAEAEIRIDFEESLFGGNAVGDFRDGVPGAYAFFDNPKFIDEFARRTQVGIYRKDEAGFVIDLAGSAAAIKAVRACQAEQ